MMFQRATFSKPTLDIRVLMTGNRAPLNQIGEYDEHENYSTN